MNIYRGILAKHKHKRSRDAALARQLEEIFERDRKYCVELKLQTWQARGLWHRALDNTFYAFNELP